MKQSITYPLFIILTFVASLATAQDYVLTLKGDTLKGQVKMFVNGFDKKVQVTQDNKKKLTFNILQVKLFTINEDHYRPVKYGETYLFMKILKQGYLSLYAFQLNGQLNYDGRYLLKLDGNGMELPNLGFKKHMTRFLSECPQVTNQIEEGKLGYSNVDTIIDQFNTCISSNTAYVSSQIITNSTKPVDIPNAKLDQWTALESKIKDSDLPEKNDALDMVKEIKNKLSKGEQVPKFLSEALKNTLKTNEALSAELAKNLEEL